MSGHRGVGFNVYGKMAADGAIYGIPDRPRNRTPLSVSRYATGIALVPGSMTHYHKAPRSRARPVAPFWDWLGTVARNLVAKYRRQPAQRIRGQGGDSDNGHSEPELIDDRADELWEAAYEQAMLAVLLDVVRREVTPDT